MSIQNLSKGYADKLNDGEIKIICGDGRLGYAQEAPYDAIHVGAAAETVPDALIEQLAPGGKLVLPVGKRNQEILMFTKQQDGKLLREKLLDVRYVPLTDAAKQCPELYNKQNKKN